MDCIRIFLHIVAYMVAGVLTFECETKFDFYAHEECQKFYRCLWEKPYVFTCPVGTKWHQDVLTCDFEHKVDCEAPRTPLKTTLSGVKGGKPIAFIHHMMNSSRKRKLSDLKSVPSELSPDGGDISSDTHEGDQDFYAREYDHDYDAVGDVVDTSEKRIDESGDDWANNIAGNNENGEGFNRMDNSDEGEDERRLYWTETYPRPEKYLPVYSVSSAGTTEGTPTTTMPPATEAGYVGGEGVDMIHQLTRLLESRRKKVSPLVQPDDESGGVVYQPSSQNNPNDNSRVGSIFATSSLDKIDYPFLQRFLDRLRKRRPGRG